MPSSWVWWAPGVRFLVVIGALLIGSIIGSLAGIESQLERFGGWLQNTLAGKGRSSFPDSTVGSGDALPLEGLIDAPLALRAGSGSLTASLTRRWSLPSGPSRFWELSRMARVRESISWR